MPCARSRNGDTKLKRMRIEYTDPVFVEKAEQELMGGQLARRQLVLSQLLIKIVAPPGLVHFLFSDAQLVFGDAAASSTPPATPAVERCSKRDRRGVSDCWK